MVLHTPSPPPPRGTLLPLHLALPGHSYQSLVVRVRYIFLVKADGPLDEALLWVHGTCSFDEAANVQFAGSFGVFQNHGVLFD